MSLFSVIFPSLRRLGKRATGQTTPLHDAEPASIPRFSADSRDGNKRFGHDAGQDNLCDTMTKQIKYLPQANEG